MPQIKEFFSEIRAPRFVEIYTSNNSIASSVLLKAFVSIKRSKHVYCLFYFNIIYCVLTC